MVSRFPDASQIPGLRALWGCAFGDSEAFLDSFFQIAYSPDRCRCIMQDGSACAALYWFVGSCRGEKAAYLYAIATDAAHRRRGLCRTLMTETHDLLQAQGFSIAMLSPETPSLAEMYTRLGYRYACGSRRLSVHAGGGAVRMRPIPPDAYRRLRSSFLPNGGVQQDVSFFRLLATDELLYAGQDFLLAAHQQDGRLYATEFLGNTAACPGILQALGLPCGTFCIAGNDDPKIFFLPLNEKTAAPTYFGPVLG